MTTRISVYVRKFKLGTQYDVILFNRIYNNCLFIKVTRKGFNFLLPTTKSCLLIRSHLYSKGYSGKDLPDLDYITNNGIMFFVPEFLTATTSGSIIPIEGNK